MQNVGPLRPRQAKSWALAAQAGQTLGPCGPGRPKVGPLRPRQAKSWALATQAGQNLTLLPRALLGEGLDRVLHLPSTRGPSASARGWDVKQRCGCKAKVWMVCGLRGRVETPCHGRMGRTLH
eukprot:362486-Chlamydomonas_euryale.AAC.3